MPNHVTHRMVVEGSAAAIADFLARAIKPADGGDEEYFDFNAITPKPAILDRIPSPASFGENGRTMLYGEDDGSCFINMSRVEATEEEEAEIQASGARDWYNWSITNWGTKWGAYSFKWVSQDDERLEFMFDTAWSPGIPVYQKMVDVFPDITFEVTAFDEGWLYAYTGSGGDGLYADMELPANNETYERVYGYAPEADEEEVEDA